MRKVLFVVNDYDFFLTHRFPLAEACLHKGWEVHIATPQEFQAKADAEKKGLFWHGLTLDAGGYNPLSDLQFLKELTTLYKSIRPELVHHVTMKAVLYGSIAARRAKVSAVVNALSGLGYLYINDNLKTRFIRLGVTQMFKWGFKHPNNRLILQNNDDKKLVLDYKLLPEDNIEIIRGSGVNTEKFGYSEEPSGHPRVILPGRMLWDKGAGEFIKAAKRILNKGIKASFHLYGRTDSKNPQSIPKEKLEAWDQESQIFYEGFQKPEDMVEVLEESNIVCLPSYREGLPKALLEAASIGRAIVTTDAPGCREVVDDGENGFLVPVKDVDILANRLEKLIEDQELREKFGKRGREKVLESLSVEHVVNQTLNLYEELLN